MIFLLKGVLNKIFSCLYDNDVLSVDGFIKWKESTDQNEQFEKGMEGSNHELIDY